MRALTLKNICHALNLRKYVLPLLMLCAAGVGPSAHAQPPGTRSLGVQTGTLFGALSFRSDSLAAFPRWQSVLEKIRRDEAALDACARYCTSPAIITWRAFIRDAKAYPYDKKLKETNMFANRWPYVWDSINWGKSDYWASPQEMLKKASGDCEDYAIFKYVTLKRLGVSPENMQVLVVRDSLREAGHAVLIVSPSQAVGSVTKVLDNFVQLPLYSTKVWQYSPIYGVNDTSRWVYVSP